MTPTVYRRVVLSYDDEAVGKVIFAGPEQSTIKFDDGKERHVPNRYILDHIEGEDMTAKKATKPRKAKAPREDKAKASRKSGKWSGYRLIITAESNPRNKGTIAFDRWAEMEAFVKKHPEATIEEIHKACPTYRGVDRDADAARKSIKIVPL